MSEFDHSPTLLLAEVRCYIRNGLPALQPTDADNFDEWKQKIEHGLQLIETAVVEGKDGFSATELLQLATLHTEFHDLLGQEAQAIKRILPHVSPGIGTLWERTLLNLPSQRLVPRLESVEGPGRAKLARQIAWLHMEYAWVCLYRTGKFDQAIDHLQEVRKFLERELLSESPCHGSLARYFYYRGHCERSLRDFKKAHESFRSSQLHAEARYRMKCQERKGGEYTTEWQARLEEERRFMIACTARILGAGLAWNGLNTGELAHAQVLCMSALALLKGVGQLSYMRVIEANRLIAERRAQDSTNTAALRGLRQLRRQHAKVNGDLGQLRCGVEYVRGYLDCALYWNNGVWPKGAKRRVYGWLEHLGAIALRMQDGSWVDRIELMRLRADLVSPTESSPNEVLSLSLQLEPRLRNTPLLPDYQLLRGLILFRMGRIPDSLALTRQVTEWAEKNHDAVVEGEGRLQMAESFLELGDYVSARGELARWKNLALGVENAYLHQYASIIREQLNTVLSPFVVRVDDDLTWEKRELELKMWLADAAQYRAQREGLATTGVVIAKILGINPSSWSRWPKRKRRSLEGSPLLVDE